MTKGDRATSVSRCRGELLRQTEPVAPRINKKEPPEAQALRKWQTYSPRERRQLLASFGSYEVWALDWIHLWRGPLGLRESAGEEYKHENQDEGEQDEQCESEHPLGDIREGVYRDDDEHEYEWDEWNNRPWGQRRNDG